jgi:hypothetical protein
VLGPKAVALQELAFEAISKAEKDVAYAEFFRLHMVVRGLHMVNVGLAATLLIVKLRRAVLGSMSNRKVASSTAGDQPPPVGGRP